MSLQDEMIWGGGDTTQSHSSANGSARPVGLGDCRPPFGVISISCLDEVANLKIHKVKKQKIKTLNQLIKLC